MSNQSSSPTNLDKMVLSIATGNTELYFTDLAALPQTFSFQFWDRRGCMAILFSRPFIVFSAMLCSRSSFCRLKKY